MIVSDIGGQHRAVCVGSDGAGYIALVIATSQIEKRKEYASKSNLHSEESLVVVNKEEYRSKENPNECSLTKETCFDCNNAFFLHETNLPKKVIQCDKVPLKLLKKISYAVKMSPAIDGETKERFKLV